MLTNKELAELLEKCRYQGNLLFAPQSVQKKLEPIAPDLAAELIRCRELLAGIYASVDSRMGGEGPVTIKFDRAAITEWRDAAKKYLTETE